MTTNMIAAMSLQRLCLSIVWYTLLLLLYKCRTLFFIISVSILLKSEIQIADKIISLLISHLNLKNM